MTLKEQREEWEEGGVEELCVTSDVNGYKTVMVIVSFSTHDMIIIKYQLLRYFKIGEEWVVSSDVTKEGVYGLECCMEYMTKQFEELYPQE